MRNRPERSASLRSRSAELLLGPLPVRRLTVVHALDDLADAMVNFSLIGSLFFAVSLDASRGRILLYLLLTAVPLAVAAPVVGPALDRTRAGYRVAIVGSQLVRAGIALALFGSLLTVTLYPLAFVLLVSRKVYTLAKAALLPQMTTDRLELVRADANLARTGTIVGGLGTSIGVTFLGLGMVDRLLLVAAPVFLVAGLVGLRLPTSSSPLHVGALPRLSEIIPPNIWAATAAVAAIRAAAGALTYLLALAIKRGGDEWIFAGGLIAAGVGAFLATTISTRLHRTLEPDGVLVLALLLPALITGIGVISIGNLGVLAIAFAIGLGNGVASRAIAVLQATAPALARSRTISRSEVLFQVAGLAGAALAVGLAPTPRPGLAVASALLLVAGLAYASRMYASLHQQASRILLKQAAPAVHTSLPEGLLVEAERLASLGAYRMAIVVADSAVDIALRYGHHPVSSITGVADWKQLVPRITGVKDGTYEPHGHDVIAVLGAARVVVDHAEDVATSAHYSSRTLL